MCSLSFVFLFLPAALFLFGISPVRLRALTLTVISLFFYYWLERENVLLLLSVILFDYAMGRLMEKCNHMAALRRAILICSVTKSVILIFIYGVFYQLYGTHIPLGLAVVCLTSAGYIIDCYMGYTQCESSIVSYAAMNSFFPKLYAGPLVYHNKMQPQLKSMRLTLGHIGEGGCVFVRGLAKKVLLGDTIYRIFLQTKEMPLVNLTPVAAWTLVVTLALSLYLVLSGYCEMAKGIGLMFGLDLPENFHYPYRSTSVNEFFSRFNITVNRFFRRYVYINLGGAQGSVASSVFNIALVSILIGLWFDIRINLLVWGLYFSVLVIFERYVLSRFMDQIAPLFRWLYCTFVVIVSLAIYAGNSIGQSLDYLGRMFGLVSMSAFDNQILYLLASNYLVLIVGILYSVGLFEWIASIARKHFVRLWSWLSLGFHILLLLVTVVFLV